MSAAPRLSILLIDWKVRESFHALEFLGRQDVARDLYEVIWIEHYEHRPPALARALDRGLLDRWIVLGREDRYFKHQLYNEGLLAARGEIVSVCDSDACFSPRFVRSILESFDAAGPEGLVLYHEEVRSDNRDLHPFPEGATWEAVMAAPGLMNWDARAGRPRGLTLGHDPLHTLNYGACMTVRRADAIACGGFDEHPHYHAFICGPYELGFRLVNRGAREAWHPDEWLLHTWHPWVRPEVDVFGHHDGRNVSSLALEARETGRIEPWVMNERVRAALAASGTPRPAPGVPAAPASFATLDPARLRERTASPPRAVRLMHGPRLARALYLAPYRADDPIQASLEASGLCAELEVFSYDTYVHRFGQEFMESQLGILCRQFRPEVLVFTPRADEPLPGADRIEPPVALLTRLAAEAGSRVVLAGAPAGRRHTWTVEGWSVLGTRGEPGEVEFWPIADDRIFVAPRARRDIPLWADGPIPIGGAKERCLATWAREGAPLLVRPFALRADERAALYGRTRIVLNLVDEDRRPRDAHLAWPETERAIEAAACGACLVQSDAIPMPPDLVAGVDYLVFREQDGPGAALALAARPGSAERIGASAAARVRDRLAPRPAWTRALAGAGVVLEKGAAMALRHWASSSKLGQAWKRRTERRALERGARIALFGAGPSGVQARKRWEESGFHVIAWLDNAADRQGKLLEGLPIHHPRWLIDEGASRVDAVVLAFQGRKNPVRWQLADLGWTGPILE